MTQNTETQALTDDDLVERLRKRAADDRGFQKNNEAVAVALKAKLAIAMRCVHYYAAAPSCERAREFLAEINTIGGKDE